MVDINKIFDLHNKLDEIERRKQLYEHIERSRFSAFNEHNNFLIEKIAKANRELYSPINDLNNRFRDLYKPSEHLNKYIEEMAKPSNFFDNLKFAEKSINQSFFDKINGFEHFSFRKTQKMIDEIFSPLSKNNLISERVFNDLNRIRESMLTPLHSRYTDLLREYEQAKKATLLSSVEAFSKTIFEKNIFRNEIFMRQISSSLVNYDLFTNNTLSKLSFEADKSISLALKGSLTLANEQMLRSTSSIQSYVENSRIAEFDSSISFFENTFPKTNRYRVQKQELLRRNDIEEEENYESLVIKSDSAISFEQITNCMTLIGLCNEASETTRGNTIFTLTSALWLSAWKLTGVVPTNKDSFAIIIDCLYLMLYEGAGKDKLRFIEQGYINATEAELIWKIKHLRNKWLRHDIDHGKETDIRKSRQHRKEALEWFGLSKVPYSKDEFIYLYNNLMLRVEDFLKLLLNRVSKFSS